jgi:hypothetical protein
VGREGWGKEGGRGGGRRRRVGGATEGGKRKKCVGGEGGVEKVEMLSSIRLLWQHTSARNSK